MSSVMKGALSAGAVALIMLVAMYLTGSEPKDLHTGFLAAILTVTFINYFEKGKK